MDGDGPALTLHTEHSAQTETKQVLVTHHSSKLACSVQASPYYGKIFIAPDLPRPTHPPLPPTPTQFALNRPPIQEPWALGLVGSVRMRVLKRPLLRPPQLVCADHGS